MHSTLKNAHSPFSVQSVLEAHGGGSDPSSGGDPGSGSGSGGNGDEDEDEDS
jgi:hypothetical protein